MREERLYPQIDRMKKGARESQQKRKGEGERRRLEVQGPLKGLGIG